MTSRLLEAAQKGDLYNARYIISNAPHSIHDRDTDGFTALHKAAYWGQSEMCKFLIDEAHADIDATTKAGRTAFYYASFRGNDAAVHVLIERGASMNLRSPSKRDVSPDKAGDVGRLLPVGVHVERKRNAPLKTFVEISTSGKLLSLPNRKNSPSGKAESKKVPKSPTKSGPIIDEEPPEVPAGASQQKITRRSAMHTSESLALVAATAKGAS
jgi:ankyrin repeat protein